jgi:hypothetical protein
VLALGVLLASAGCSERSPDEMEAAEQFPEALQFLQGSWIGTASDESSCECEVQIEGSSVRIRYREGSTAPVIRENSMINGVDEENHRLIMGEGQAAWEYRHGAENGREVLELEFYSPSIEGGRRRMQLTRKQDVQG